LILLVIFLWKQFVVVPVDESSHRHNNKLLPEKDNKMNQVTDTTNCFQRKITRRIKSQAQQQTAVPVT
jgi:hypothetical protein